MIYTDLYSLSIACANVDLKDTHATKYLSSLLKVYFDAYHNPPDGVIGVGVLTYAGQKLVDFQLNEGVE